MMTFKNVNKVLLLFFFMHALTACIDDDYIVDNCYPEQPAGGVFEDAYSLNVVVTLDDMGGTRATTLEELKIWEDYIDPEKFRVLFFNSEEKLLFESKSRWVKQFNSENRWLVSVPLFSYGNDVYDEGDWPWEAIRDALTSGKFKIAILANRPELEWYPGNLKGTDPDAEAWIDNTGPHWTPKDYLRKDVFDLHHCQYDPLYHGKSSSDGFYDFIMGNWETWSTDTTKVKPTMGATSSWVEWGTVTDSHGWKKRHTILPSREHPIPMYGIQEFDAINPSLWQKGTPFNLSDNITSDGLLNDGYVKKSISLLRSVVKLELLISRSSVQQKPDFVNLCYANIYARCEPLNVWKPTDQLWEEQHEGYGYGSNDNCKDMVAMLNYGPIATTGNGKLDYQNKIKWFYGAWVEKGWTFKNNEGRDLTPQTVDGIAYPQIMNSCIQRNAEIVVSDKGDLSASYSDKDYYYYVAYVGERNLNDPSALGTMDKATSGQPTVMYWLFNDKGRGRKYGVPITDYSVSGNPVFNGVLYEDYTGTSDPSKTSFMNDYYMQFIMDEKLPQNRPWPLIRNHVYRLVLKTAGEPSRNKIWDFTQPLRDATKYNLNGGWTKNSGYWSNPQTNGNSVNDGIARANSCYIIELYGIDIRVNDNKNLSSGNIRIYDNKIVFTTVDVTFKLTGLKANDKIKISSSSEPSIFSGSVTKNERTGNITTWTVTSNGSVAFKTPTTNFEIYSIETIENNTTRSASKTSNGLVIQSEDLHSKSLKVD